ncbi:MAG: hypothetical protein PHU95_03505 [Candidatus Thermoplasmatota archaeon]|nr:hypothetical protein [Candidatus Thermoplasmatota archaeon]
MGDLRPLTLGTELGRAPTSAVVEMGAYTGNDAGWQTLVEWTVPDGTGVLREVAFTLDGAGAAVYRLEAAGVELFTDFTPERDVNLPFPNVRLPEGAVVTLQVHSDGVTNITVNGSITGGVV